MTAPAPAGAVSTSGAGAATVLTVGDIGFEAPAALLARHGLVLAPVAAGAPIPGSYWGECEAGLVGSTVFARPDTPVHSLLHEACHLIVMPPERRAAVHTDATDSVPEEDAACYLQILLADALPGVGRDRLMADMDAWGYSFRLGSARAWFEHDAEDARAFLAARALLPNTSLPNALLPNALLPNALLPNAPL
ncbi:MAG TPA: hypothetical protein VFQ84_02295 [Arenimonas sp.]|uniref:hypothetical protein n=1 Tax=Arenimonas sp. TaxID=1872635 RepID=UPI002D80590C|nr:hypothetical protein [Arenimonas sp.]HEU0152156.1 hypothetical protein [Arenimonas sp.]